MKITNIILGFITFLFPFSSFAYDFEVNGLYFNVISIQDLTCEVADNYNYDKDEAAYSGSITIPEKVEYNNREFKVIGLGTRAFQFCKELSDVKLPDTIEFFGEGVFYRCENLKSINIPPSLSIISKYSFAWCKSLNEIIIPGTVNEIGEEAFYQTVIKNLVIEDSSEPIILSTTNISWNYDSSILRMNSGSFLDCKIQDFYLGRNLEKNQDGFSPFTNIKNLETLEVGQMVTSLPLFTFFYLERVYYNVPQVYSYEYRNLPTLQSLIVNSSELDLTIGSFYRYWDTRIVSENGNWVNDIELFGADFENVIKSLIGRNIVDDHIFNIFGNVKEIIFLEPFNNLNPYVLRHCNDLESIEFPESLLTIEGGSFQDTKKLSKIICKAKLPPSFDSYNGSNDPNFTNFSYLNAELIVPDESLELYSNADYWDNFFNIKGLSNLGGVESLLANSHSKISVYTKDGILIKKDCKVEDINALSKGIYIIKSGNKSYKIAL